MLASNNLSQQYLMPDYLTPSPATLDAKNSPLALLAQTCSAIGADSPNPKLLANIENATKSHKSYECRDKLSPGSQSSLSSNHSSETQLKSSFKPYDASTRNKLMGLTTDEHQRTLSSSSSSSAGRTKTPKSINLSMGSNSGRSESVGRGSSSPRVSTSPNINRKTPSATASTLTGNGGQIHQQQRSSPTSSQHQHKINTNNSGTNPPSSSTSMNGNSNSVANLSTNGVKTTAANVSTEQSVKDLFARNLSKTISPTTSSTSSSSYFNEFPSSGLPYSMDLLTASALMSPHHQSMLKQAALSPYFNYARTKGTEMLSSPPICRDPYCTGCPYSSHLMGKTPSSGQCPAGCTQCDHPKQSTAYPVSSASSVVSHAAAAAYAQAQLAAFAASQMYYTCNWVGHDTAYCGKRFATSDELFQHLRSHTGSIPESLLTTATGLPAAASALYQRTYPTPPLSPLSSARYHPYSKPMLPPSALVGSPLAGLSLPPGPLSLAQYFSPYGLYGRNPSSMHP